MPEHCVVIPFFGRHEAVGRCLSGLLLQGTPDTHILLVDDGSQLSAIEHPLLQRLLDAPRVHLIRHRENRGVAAARNSALHWCRQHGFDLVLMLDSDCEPGPALLFRHLALQEEFPDATAIAGAVIGRGRGIWAWIDGILSWPNSRAFGATRKAANTLYHLPMTNIALRLSHLPERDFVFDERLGTGEDSQLIRELLQGGRELMFSPATVVYHEDRNTLVELFRHHYEWGHHQYFVQLGKDFRRPVFHPVYRALFLFAFAAALPVYAVLGATLNIWPWLHGRPSAALAFLPALFLWFGKGLAVLEAAARPKVFLRATRPTIAYEETRPALGKEEAREHHRTQLSAAASLARA